MKETAKTKLENYVVDSVKKKNGGVIDERMQLQNSTAIATGVSFAIVFDIVMMAVHFIKHNTEAAYPYLAQLLVICAGFGLASLGNKEPGLPRTLSGRNVDPEKSGKAFTKRLLACLLDSLVTCGAIMCFNAYDKGGFSGEIIKDAVIMIVIFLVIEVAVCESRVSRWHKFQAQLDAEENDLD